MRSTKTIIFTAVSAFALSACGGSGGTGSGARDYVTAVGSSTVYPFATAVAEQFAKTSGSKSPVIESTGTGAGMKLFCAGVGAQHPDVEDASRRMKKSEYELCQKNGVTEIVEIQVGIDGIAFAESKDGPGMMLTPTDIYKALAANPYGKPNTAKTWSDVNPSLPNEPILVYGPPSTSGTRDALKELILEAGCKTDDAMKALKDSDKEKYEQTCHQIREDGPYVDAGENDNLIVQKISQNPKAIGIFGYSFLEENADKLKGVPLSNVEPTYESISDFSYPGARPLYIYVKKQHLAPIQGLQAYINEWPKVWGPDGLLKKKGMVISPDDVRAKNAEVIANMTPLDPSVLK
ncbi:MAG: phosphate ABC transporter substrate-binding protein [Novosphingobium sp.]|uniref:Phosphate ABC transporter substrate-binding protein n=1 Tax=Novosphingobium indicum TaxID=462949 RepID=A0ABQ2JMR5_9SPHN|nr:substrate-binding domain-containing protein [Novosphingobium indicum]MAC58938.1 phosphate ABC transporter substrate-binding protein [Novosphingobium sp.]GGN50886.1 phosphate ABC transporter substrate-binding protein [Novosphingobium indicum]